MVALLGSNGAGKSTTLKAISGLLPSENGEITEGDVLDRGEASPAHAGEIVRLGVSQVMEGRHVFGHLSVEENLVAGAYTRPDSGRVDLVYEYFPQLKARRSEDAGYLSGGEQQMLAIGRALMSRPRLLMLDEPSLGLAPLLVGEIFGIVERLNRELKTTILLVEQNARLALASPTTATSWRTGASCSRAYADLAEPGREGVLPRVSESGRKSYRDVKHYKRRKRWL